MTTQTLSHITLQTLENYRTAGTQAVTAYRLGGHRLVGAVNQALKDRVYPRTAQLSLNATNRMNEVRGNVSDLVVKGIDQVAERTEQAIELSSNTAAAQVTKVAKFAARVDNDVVANGLQAAARLTMPGAKVALAVSTKVAKGAKALAGAAGSGSVSRATRKAATSVKRQAAPVARKAAATVKKASRRVAKVAKSVDQPAARGQRRTSAAK